MIDVSFTIWLLWPAITLMRLNSRLNTYQFGQNCKDPFEYSSTLRFLLREIPTVTVPSSADAAHIKTNGSTQAYIIDRIIVTCSNNVMSPYQVPNARRRTAGQLYPKLPQY